MIRLILLKIKKGWIRVLFLISLTVTESCKKFVDIELAPNLIQTSQVFAEDKTAQSAVNGVYYQMRAANLYATNGGVAVYGGLSADELEYNGASPAVYEFFRNSLLANNSTVNTNLWSYTYRLIYEVNAVIEGISNSNSITEILKQQLLGEMKVVRAFLNFNLVNLFGDVPLVLSTGYKENAALSRTAAEQVYSQIISDLKEAETEMEPLAVSGKTRPSKWAAKSLLARVYLYRNDWVKAEAKASEIINSGVFSLIPPAKLINAFQINSAETIWEIPNDNTNTAEGASFIPSTTSQKPTYTLSNSFLSAIEPGDRRKSDWMKNNVIGGISYYYPYKYKERGSVTVKEYNIVLRLAEQYLIRAEARARQGKIAAAAEDLNIIRKRAELPDTPAITEEELLLAIEQERRIELFAESGHRWFDLKRTGRANEILGFVKAPDWQATDALYPIPETQLLLNIYLVQNPGYQ